MIRMRDYIDAFMVLAVVVLILEQAPLVALRLVVISMAGAVMTGLFGGLWLERFAERVDAVRIKDD